MSPDHPGTLIRSEKRVVLGTDDAAPTPRQLINALLDGPNSAELRSPFPASLHVRSVTESDGLLYIDFSGSYAEMEPFERRLADCCLFQTVSALDGIYSVSLYANGIPLPDGQALTKSSFITQTDFFQSAAADVVFYYPASDLESLHAEARTCTIYQDTSAAETVVQILFDDFFRCNPAGVYFPFVSASQRSYGSGRRLCRSIAPFFDQRFLAEYAASVCFGRR